MKNPRIVLGLTVVNAVLLALTLTHQFGLAFAESSAPVLRGRGLQIVDDQGRVRASITVLPASRSANGDEYAETVLLRLITERGRPTVKLGASEPVSGLSLVGPSGTSNTYAILGADGTASSLKLRSEDGGEKLFTP